VEIDLLLLLLRDVVARRARSPRPLRLVLMSATAEADLFERYIGGAVRGRRRPLRRRMRCALLLQTALKGRFGTDLAPRTPLPPPQNKSTTKKPNRARGCPSAPSPSRASRTPYGSTIWRMP